MQEQKSEGQKETAQEREMNRPGGRRAGFKPGSPSGKCPSEVHTAAPGGSLRGDIRPETSWVFYILVAGCWATLGVARFPGIQNGAFIKSLTFGDLCARAPSH